MSALDVAILLVATAAAVGGWRFGFLPRLFAWAGVGVGLLVAVRLVPRIVTTYGGTSADTRASAALAFLVLTAMVGHGMGLGVGGLVRRGVGVGSAPPRWDRFAGAALGVLGVGVLVWMTTPSLATAQGWPARAARDSLVANLVERWGPEQPDSLAEWGRAIADAPYPVAVDPFDAPSDVGPPPELVVPAQVDAAARAATVRVVGGACDRIQEGTGFVARPGLVVTNAHVVAGERDTVVEDGHGAKHDAAVVAFDPDGDLAVLAAPTLDAPALPIATGAVDDTGAVYGHPGGGPLRVSPARVAQRIQAVGTDIYRRSESRRDVYVLAASLQPGDSGAALVDLSGRVIGIAFAIDPGDADTAYALTDAAIRRVLDAVEAFEVDTGPCLVG